MAKSQKMAESKSGSKSKKEIFRAKNLGLD